MTRRGRSRCMRAKRTTLRPSARRPRICIRAERKCGQMRRLVAHAGLVFGFSHLQLLIEQPAPTRGVPACGRRTPMPWPPFNGMPLTPTPTATPPPKIFGGP